MEVDNVEPKDAVDSGINAWIDTFQILLACYLHDRAIGMAKVID